MLNDFLAKCGRVSLIGWPTGENSMLCLLPSTDAALISNPRVSANFGTSDHRIIGVENIGYSRSVVTICRGDFGYCNWAQIIDWLLGYDCDFEFSSCRSIEDICCISGHSEPQAVRLRRNKTLSAQMPSYLQRIASNDIFCAMIDEKQIKWLHSLNAPKITARHVRNE